MCISMEEHTSPLSALVRDLDGGGCNGDGTLVFRARIPQRGSAKEPGYRLSSQFLLCSLVRTKAINIITCRHFRFNTIHLSVSDHSVHHQHHHLRCHREDGFQVAVSSFPKRSYTPDDIAALSSRTIFAFS